METKGQIVSRLRQSLKETSSDSNYSNRALWFEFLSCARVLIKRDADSSRQIYSTNDIWQNICIKMEKTSPLLCTCISLPMDCSIFRSTFKIPKTMESSTGMIYRALSTLDNSYQFTIVTPFEFKTKTNIRYNKGKYAFIFDGYLWTNQTYPNLVLSAIFVDSVKGMSCSEDVNYPQEPCPSKLTEPSGVPDYLVEPAIRMVLQKLSPTLGKPLDNIINTSESQREVSL